MTQTQRRRVKRLVAALRSGKFVQARQRLCITDGKEKRYCCLGVASLVTARATGARFVEQHFDAYEHAEYGTGAEGEEPCRYFHPLALEIDPTAAHATQYPFEEVALSLGVHLDDLKEYADLNDAGRSFDEIADRIERDLLGGAL